MHHLQSRRGQDDPSQPSCLDCLGRDAFPVTRMHALVIPIRHAPDYLSLTAEELLACDDLLRRARELLTGDDASIEGFNIGLNVGAAAGQTVFHCHFHLIPRRVGDVENARGGVRHLFPGKGTTRGEQPALRPARPQPRDPWRGIVSSASVGALRRMWFPSVAACDSAVTRKKAP
ncbi:MAG TPA: HIT family protein [Thermoleophilia bacterium]|nr:HIT family protein [Thermoleophilia bacterium]